jgi:excisionase family DNA binding protein
MATQRVATEQFLTPADVAALVFVDPKTVSRWARAGKIPSTRTPGGHPRFLKADVEALMCNNRDEDHLLDEAVRAPLDDGTIHTPRVPGQRAKSLLKRPGRRATRSIDSAAADAMVGRGGRDRAGGTSGGSRRRRTGDSCRGRVSGRDRGSGCGEGSPCPSLRCC